MNSSASSVRGGRGYRQVADDIEKVRQYNRDMVLLHPPMKENTICRAGHSNECSTDMVIDQQAVDNRLSQVEAQARDSGQSAMCSAGPAASQCPQLTRCSQAV